MAEQGRRRRRRFDLGLVMAGAVSGGAYAAGVVDFLIQALDAWHAAKADRAGAMPGHDVRIRAMSGASAGAITAAIAANAFASETEPVTDVDRPPAPERNRLYDAWVRQIDISKLLGRRDIEQTGHVISLLDSTEIETIAALALRTERRAAGRPYIDDPLALFLTVANLRGVPYGFHVFGHEPDTRYGMSNHMDDMRFAVSMNGKTFDGARALDPADAPDDGHWPTLAQAALASGAFPIGLAPRTLERPASDFDARLGRKPAWDTPPDPYRFLCVDGGLMNNEPLELARRHLSGGANRKNPREGEKASRAVVMIDPFPNEVAFNANWQPDNRLSRIFLAMFNALKNQARFKPEELALAEDDGVYSRFMISPSRQDAQGNPVEPAMAAGILGGFGGFFHETFRRHDFQLGRRNCQAFLRWHLSLPQTNPLFAGIDPTVRDRFQVRGPDGTPWTKPNKAGEEVPRLPIIPLTGELSEPIPLPAPPSGEVVDLPALRSGVKDRVEVVGKTLFDTDLKDFSNSAVRWVLKRAWEWAISGRVTDRAVETIKTELNRL